MVRLLGHGRWKGLPFLILEFIPGGTLKDAIAQFRAEGRLYDFPRALSWFLEVLEGLEEVHRLGLVHRDIKPSNILLNERGKAVLADLGIFKRVGHETTSLTATGSGLGTYAYMAPEQWENPSQVDQRADLYSLGVTFHEVLTCQLPFGRWQPPSQLNPALPPAFDALLEKLLAHRAEDRFGSVAEVFQAVALSGLISGAPPVAQPRIRSAGPPLADVLPRESVPPTEAVAGAVNINELAAANAPQTVVDQPPIVSRRWTAGWQGTRAGLFLGLAAAMLLASALFVIQLATLQKGRGTGPSAQPAITAEQLSALESGASTPERMNSAPGSAQESSPLRDATPGQLLRRCKAEFLCGHCGPVWSAAFSPDATKILTGSLDTTARLWDANTGKVLRVFQGHEENVTSVAFSPDGTKILTGSDDKTARLWRATGGSELLAFAHERAVVGVGFIKRGKITVTAIFGPKIHFWDAVTYQPILTLCCVDQVGEWLVFAPDGRFDASPGATKYLGLFDPETGKQLSDEEMERYRTPGLAREILAGY